MFVNQLSLSFIWVDLGTDVGNLASYFERLNFRSSRRRSRSSSLLLAKEKRIYARPIFFLLPIEPYSSKG